MFDQSTLREESPIYARLREIYALADDNWVISAPPQFRREMANRHGWSGWFEQQTPRDDVRMTC